MNYSEQKFYTDKSRLDKYKEILEGTIKDIDISSLITQPAGITLKLKVHQLAMIQRAMKTEDISHHEHHSSKVGEIIKVPNYGVGIICDKVGAGKSMSILGLIAAKKDITIENRYTKKIKNLEIKNYVPINVIVVPHGIFKQWKDYIDKNTTLKCYSVNRATDIQDDLTKYTGSDLVLVSATQYKKFSDGFNEGNKEAYINRLIFDESDSIKIANVPQIYAKYYWFISSSITNLFYPRGDVNLSWFTESNIKSDGVAHKGFIKDEFCRISIDQLFNPIDYYLKNSDDVIEKSFKLPDPKTHIIKCDNPQSLKVLEGIIPEDVVDLINAGDTETAIEKLHCDKGSTESIVKAAVRDLEMALEKKKQDYAERIIEANQKEFATDAAKKRYFENIDKTYEKYYADIESKICSIKDRILKNDMCPICYCDIVDPVVVKCCQNKFCFGCLSLYLSGKGNCLICQKEITTSDLIIIKENIEETELDINEEEKTKPLMFERLITDLLKDPKKRIMIFSERDNTFNIVSEILKKNSIQYDRVLGTGAHIAKVIDRYRNGDLQVLLTNATYFGAGMNMENTTDSVIYHKMATDLDKQVVGRAQRLGRTDSLNIWRLCYPNEL
jgi:hypothetical protein